MERKEIQFRDGTFYEVKHNEIRTGGPYGNTGGFYLNIVFRLSSEMKELPYYPIRLMWGDLVYALFENDDYRIFKNGVEIYPERKEKY